MRKLIVFCDTDTIVKRAVQLYWSQDQVKIVENSKGFTKIKLMIDGETLTLIVIMFVKYKRLDLAKVLRNCSKVFYFLGVCEEDIQNPLSKLESTKNRLHVVLSSEWFHQNKIAVFVHNRFFFHKCVMQTLGENAGLREFCEQLSYDSNYVEFTLLEDKNRLMTIGDCIAEEFLSKRAIRVHSNGMLSKEKRKSRSMEDLKKEEEYTRRVGSSENIKTKSLLK